MDEIPSILGNIPHMLPLALSDNAQMALIVILGTFVAAITTPIVGILISISHKIDRVEKQTNGRLSVAESKVKIAETLSPGITEQQIPPDHEITVTRVINNTLNNDPAVEISRVTTPPQLPPDSKESP